MNEFDVKKIHNASYLLTDVMQGDSSVIEREDFNDLEKREIKQALKVILSSKHLSERDKIHLLSNTYKIFFRSKPPSMEEFLTVDWIGPTANNLFPKVRNALCEFMAPDSEYRHLILASSIGSGKSTTTAILCLYIITSINLMHDPKKFFNLAQSGSIVGALISFSIKKAKQLLANPFYLILTSSQRFVRVKQQERLEIKQHEIGPDKIAWTSASRMDGILETARDTHIVLASDPANLLGLNLIFSAMSELSFFIDKGVSPEEIWRIYNDSKGRVYSRFGLGESNKFFGITIMDSSPNDIELPVDKYVFTGEASKNPLNYVVTGTHWDYHPHRYPIWGKTGETFPLFRGSATHIPKVLTETEIDSYHQSDIMQVPIDAKKLFIEDIKKSTKDYAGWPAGGTNKLFDDPRQVEGIFTDNLKNHLSFIYAPADKEPEQLIWNQIKDLFFIQVNGRYEFYRVPNAIRYIAFDLSESGDMTGVSMVHMENYKGDNIVIGDFTLAISPGKSRINLDAVYEFVLDLIRIGNIRVHWVTSDSYGPSKAIIQRFKRFNMNSEVLSLDIDTAPYYTLASYAKNNRIRVGRNLVLKGNLNSLVEVRTEKGKKKIDHTSGVVSHDNSNVDWLMSSLGKNGKDVSDSFCGAVYKCITTNETASSIIWDREVVKIQSAEESFKEVTHSIYNKFGISLALFKEKEHA